MQRPDAAARWRPWGARLMVGLVLLLPLRLAAQAPCPDTYGTITKTGPKPVNFRPYRADAPWNLPLPEHPQHRSPRTAYQSTTAIQTNMREYARNSGFFLRSSAQEYYSGCTKPQPGGRCVGHAGFGLWKATTSDVPVTFICEGGNHAYNNYGCSLHDRKGHDPSVSFTYQGYVPVGLQGLLNESSVNDVNWAVIQPDGNVIEAYHCPIKRNPVPGDVIAGTQANTLCANRYIGAMGISHLVNDKGINSMIASGPTTPAYEINYNEMVPPATARIRHTINFNIGCVAPGVMFPATSGTRICGATQWDNPDQWNGQGAPTGQHFFLDLSISQIDELIRQGTLMAQFRPVYIALKEYGGYLFDTGTGTPRFEIVWLEDSSQWIKEGGQTPWAGFFQTLPGATVGNNTGSPSWFWQEQGHQVFGPIANRIVALEECYAQGTCSDSPAPEVCGPGTPGGPPTTLPVPTPTNLRVLP
jgi:hypothetical protein